MKNEVTITLNRLRAILVFAMNEICEAQNLDESYVEFAADMHAEAFQYIFGDWELPEGLEEQVTFIKEFVESITQVKIDS